MPKLKIVAKIYFGHYFANTLDFISISTAPWKTDEIPCSVLEKTLYVV